MPAEAPTTLGRYQIAEELGRGAMGVVYLGVDPVIARPVAIKVVKESEYMTPAEVEQFHARFRHEAEAAGRLSHPDIVQIYDIGPNYLVMEYIEGRPLSAVMQAGAVFTVRQVVALVQRAADAIDYAHKNGIVHRDIKPGNIMLVEDATLKVMDFGVARLDNSNLTAAGTVVGSVRYMAPEQMMGEKVDGRADVFSLAAVAYELVTAHPPFPGKTVTEVVSRVVRGGHVPPRLAEPRLPAAADRVFAKAFAPRPADRYARAVDFAREFAKAMKGALDLAILHGREAETPTEVDATAVERDADSGLRTSTSAGALAANLADATVVAEPGSAASGGDADATLVMSAKASAAPPPPPGARTVIMDVGPKQREGLLIVESDPPEAVVYVDDVRVGTTPLPDHELKFGRHAIRLEAPGRDSASLELELDARQPLRVLTVSLAPARPKDGTLRPGQHVEFGPDVLAPCRVSGALPAYPPGARERGLAGAPMVAIWIGEKGEVIDLSIVESAGAILDGALLDAVSHWRFTPARVRGVPVSVRITVQHHFRP